MDLTKFLLVAVPVLGGLAAAASPAIVLLSRARYPLPHVAEAKRFAYFSVIVAVVVVCNFSGISVALSGVNAIAGAVVQVCGLCLVAFSFTLRPRVRGVLTGVYALLAWLALVLFLAPRALTDGIAPRLIAMPDGSLCSVTAYGFITSDSGVNVQIFRRFLFVDKRIAAHRYSDIYPDDEGLIFPGQAILKQCLAAAAKASQIAAGI